jgi:lysozyme family protein
LSSLIVRWIQAKQRQDPPTGLKPHDDLLAEFPYLGPPNPYTYRTSRLPAMPSSTSLAPYVAPDSLRLNQWALSGDWTIERRASVLNRADGRIAFRFHTRDVHLVMRQRE